MIWLERRLRAASPGDVRSCIERAEALALEIDPVATYPDEWLVFRIAGLPQDVGSGALGGVVTALGADVLADLPALVERLCVQLGLTEEGLIGAGGVRAGELAERWHVSRKTLDRLRRRGLLARRGASSRSKHVLVFMPKAIAAFERLHSPQLANAGRYSRMSNEEQRQLIAEFEALRAARAISITAAARELAAKHGRSVEGVRLFLKRETKRSRAKADANARALGGSRHAGGNGQAEHGPITGRVRRVLLRASRPGLDLTNLSRCFDRTRPAVRRAVILARAEAMWRMRDAGHLIAPTSPTFMRADAPDVLLNTPIVRQGLGARGETDLLDIINGARHSPPPTGAEERARLIAYQFIRYEVSRSLDSVDRLHPKAPVVDRLETALRWAARLKAEVLRPHLRLILQTIEGRLGRRAEEVRAGELLTVISLAMRHAAHAVDLIEGTRGGRVAGPVGLAVDKGLVEWLRSKPSVDANPRRAASLLTFGTSMADWTLRVTPWQRWLEPDPRVRLAVEGGGLAKDVSSFLTARYGWAGGAPMALDELATQRGMTAIRASMFEHRCMVEAMVIARGKPKAPPARKRA